MPFELFVALRYLLGRRRRSVLPFVTLISIAGVTAGVAALIVALSLNTGFQKEFQDRILGATSHITLVRLGGVPIPLSEDLLESLEELPEVTSVAPTIYGQAQLVSDLNRERGVLLRGVDPKRKAILQDLLTKVVEGDATGFGGNESTPSMIIGKDLASDLGVLVGDYVRALGMQGELSPVGRAPRLMNFRVVAIFESGLWDYDANWCLVPIDAARRFVGMKEEEAGALEFMVQQIYEVEKTSERIRELVGPGYSVQTWIELNRPLFSALRLEKLALFIAISLIVLVASLNIVSTLTMTVMEKTRDIAIISAVGGHAGTITRIFVLQGLLIGILGTILGASLGSAAAWCFDHYKIFRLEPEVYSIPYVPFQLAISDVLLVSVLAILISLTATLYPARRASELDPVEALRYE